MTENFKRFLVALTCYFLWFAMGVTMPLQPKEFLARGILAAIVVIVMAAVVWRGSWLQRILCALFCIPAVWELYHVFRELIMGTPFSADA
jgi:hypothetical protein